MVNDTSNIEAAVMDLGLLLHHQRPGAGLEQSLAMEVASLPCNFITTAFLEQFNPNHETLEKLSFVEDGVTYLRVVYRKVPSNDVNLEGHFVVVEPEALPFPLMLRGDTASGEDVSPAEPPGSFPSFPAPETNQDPQVQKELQAKRERERQERYEADIAKAEAQRAKEREEGKNKHKNQSGSKNFVQ